MNRIKYLENMIQVCRELYYSNGTSPLTDIEYDALENELKKLDPNNTLLNQVGSYSMKDKIKHINHMLSLDKIHSLEELTKFSNKFPGEEIIAMPKVDGLPIEAVYVNGELIQASTRGDGRYGESILFNAKHIKGLPKKISTFYGNTICIYGEVVVSKEDFKRINAPLIDSEKFSDARNLAAGTLKCEDEKVVKSRNLQFIGYRLEGEKSHSFKYNLDILDEILDDYKGNEFRTHCIFNLRLKRWFEFYPTIEEMQKCVEDLWYKTDGIVFMLDNIDRYEEIGCNNHHPKYACALKFKDESMTSTVEKIELSMSRNGTLSPVAIIKPIVLDGATISRVSMTNIDNMMIYNVVEGSTVEVVRANKVIPKIISGEFPEGVTEFKIPEECPYCKSKISVSKSETGIRTLSCTNTLCYKMVSKVLEHFCNEMEIDNMGEKNCDKIAIDFIDEYEGLSGKSGSNSNLVILYFICLELGLLEQYIGSKVIAGKIYKSILNKKSGCRKVDLVAGLGITNFGRNSYEKLSKNNSEIFDMLFSKNNVSPSIFGIECSKSINEWKNKNLKLAKEIISMFTLEKTIEKKAIGIGKLSGMTFCITGTLSKSRNEFSAIIKENGGNVSDSVTKSINILLAGEDCGSKLDKAKKLGIKIVNEDEFNNMIK